MSRAAKLPVWIGLLLLVGGTADASPIYKWTESDGSVAYSQGRPKGTEVEELNLKVSPASQAEPRNAAPAQGDTPAPAAGEPTAEADAKRTEVHNKNCEIAKANLRVLDEGGLRLVTSNPDGSTKHWSEEERQAKMDEARKQIDYFCNGGKEQPAE